MRDFLFAARVLFQPFVEALRDDYASLSLFHSVPHALVLDERVVSAVDGS